VFKRVVIKNFVLKKKLIVTVIGNKKKGAID